jgi:hypothetical protein
LGYKLYGKNDDKCKAGQNAVDLINRVKHAAHHAAVDGMDRLIARRLDDFHRKKQADKLAQMLDAVTEAASALHEHAPVGIITPEILDLTQSWAGDCRALPELKGALNLWALQGSARLLFCSSLLLLSGG